MEETILLFAAGTPRNVPGRQLGHVSFEVLSKLYILPLWMICRKRISDHDKFPENIS
jgi:hypothetical protein